MKLANENVVAHLRERDFDKLINPMDTFDVCMQTWVCEVRSLGCDRQVGWTCLERMSV